TDIVPRGLAYLRVSVVRVEEGVPLSIPETRVRVHPDSIVPEDRLRHRRGDEPPPRCDVLCHELVGHDAVRHLDEGVPVHVDLALPRGCHFVVVGVAEYSEPIAETSHALAAELAQRVDWRRRVVPVLEPDREVRSPRFYSRLLRGDLETVREGVRDLPGRAVEDEELDFRSPERLRVSRRFEHLCGLLGDTSRVSRELSPSETDHNVADQPRRLVGPLPGDYA